MSIKEDWNIVKTRLPLEIVKIEKDFNSANKFVEFLQTPEAQDVFVEYGFTIHK